MKLLKYYTVVLIFFLAYQAQGQSIQKKDFDNQILGLWYLEKDTNIKIEFLPNGEINKYLNNKLESTIKYSFSEECNNEKLANHIFLKLTVSETESYCFLIKTLNKNIFSYTTSIDAAETKLIREK